MPISGPPYSPPGTTPLHAGLWPGQTKTPPNRQLSEEIMRLYSVIRTMAEEIKELEKRIEDLETGP